MKKSLLAAVAVIGLAATPVLAQSSRPSTNGTAPNATTQSLPDHGTNSTMKRHQPNSAPDQIGGGTAPNPSQAQAPRTPSELDRQDHKGSTIRHGTTGGGSNAPAPGQTSTPTR